MKLLFLVIVTNSIILFSIEAFQGNMKFKNDDNTTFDAHLFGDEWFSWIENRHKDIIVYNNESKNYEYARLENEVELKATGIKVTSENGNFLEKLTYIKFKIDRKYLEDIWKKKREEGLSIFNN